MNNLVWLWKNQWSTWKAWKHFGSSLTRKKLWLENLSLIVQQMQGNIARSLNENILVQLST